MKSTYWLFGTKLQVLQNENDTDGRYDLLEGLFPPGAKSPLHLHARYSETIIVLEGEVAVYTPGHEQILKAGESFFIPKNVPHMIANNSSDQPFKALALASPSGFARLVNTVGIPDDGTDETAQQAHDMKLAGIALAEAGDSIIGPPGTRP
jgi:mannose-6-phosphate isomerase-like protein (cupin superfamily)